MEQPGVHIGAVLAGRYRVDRVLGQGGMGIVVQAMHLQLHQPVAMKFLLPEVLGNQEVVQRFLREAQAAVRLKSEHVARVIDVGTLDTGTPYMVLEYLEGSDLSNLPRAQLTVGLIVDLMLQACEALAEAHALGIVHRDVKPANFFISRGADGQPLLKVLDFGISKSPVTGLQLTATQAVMGTPAYMSPEQMRSSRDVDHRSDIWALGIVLYELLQGAPPFGGDTFSSMVIKVVTDPLPPMTVPLPGNLAAIVYHCLEKDPARRFQNVAELAQALAPYAQTETQATISVQRTRSIVGLEARRVAPDMGPARHALAPSTLSAAAVGRTTPPVGGRRWPVIAGAATLAAAVAIAIVASRGGGPGSAVHAGGAQPAAPAPALSPAVAAPAAAPTPAPPVAAVPTPPDVATAAVAPPPSAIPMTPIAAVPANAAPAPATPASDVAKKGKRGRRSGARAAQDGSASKAPPTAEDILEMRN
jgi:eukaryotic-like serine/threonine-protein kinase